MSQTCLLIDVGNSRIKWATGHTGNLSGLLHHHGTASHDDFLDKALDSLVQPHPSLHKILVSNVAGKAVAKQIINQIPLRCRDHIEFIESTPQAAGITNGYTDPRQLGVDRWLAMIAAWQQTKKAVCVVDCGTATTLDVVDDEGQHRGGLILPGLHIMQQTLFRHTADLAELCSASEGHEPSDESSFALGKSTQQAFVCGVKQSLASLIERLMQHYSPIKLITTGGLADKMGVHRHYTAEYCPDLVLRGLQIYNALNT